MKTCDIGREQSKIELSRDELLILNAALNEVCNGIAMFEFDTRIGASRDKVAEMLREVNELLDRMDMISS